MKYVDNLEPDNIVLAHKTITNHATLTSRIQVIVKPEQFIQAHLQNLLTLLDKTSYASDITAARAAYATGLNADEKKVVQSYKTETGFTAYEALTKAEAVQKAVQKADTLYDEIDNTVFKSVSALKAKMKDLKTALELAEDYEHLLNVDQTILMKLERYYLWLKVLMH